VLYLFKYFANWQLLSLSYEKYCSVNNVASFWWWSNGKFCRSIEMIKKILKWTILHLIIIGNIRTKDIFQFNIFNLCVWREDDYSYALQLQTNDSSKLIMIRKYCKKKLLNELRVSNYTHTQCILSRSCEEWVRVSE
jgi:hypothetical protein